MTPFAIPQHQQTLGRDLDQLHLSDVYVCIYVIYIYTHVA